MTWMRAASIEEFDKKTGKEVNLSGNRIALFRSKDKFYAKEALCRHSLLYKSPSPRDRTRSMMPSAP